MSIRTTCIDYVLGRGMLRNLGVGIVLFCERGMLVLRVLGAHGVLGVQYPESSDCRTRNSECSTRSAVLGVHYLEYLECRGIWSIAL